MNYICDDAGFWLAGAPRGGTGGGVVEPPENQPPVTVADAVTVFAETPTVVDVLANDSDPEGRPLHLVSATATWGMAEVRPDGTVLYTPAPEFTGEDTVLYVAGDADGAETQGTLTVTVAGPMLSLTPNTDGTLTVEAASGEIELTVTAPPEFAGTYMTDTALLSGGPINLAPPTVQGAAEPGTGLIARPGLWIHEGDVTAEAWSWQRDGAAISGATASEYTVAPSDAGAVLAAVQTLSTAAGSRSAASAPVAAPTVFTPGDDGGLIAWFDASDAATIGASAGVVTTWADKAGSAVLAATSGPTTGSRSISGRNVLDFSGTARLTGIVTLPVSGNAAIHAMIAIDAVTSAFSAPLSMKATRDFQLDSDNATAFMGRLNVSGVGTTFQLQGGPFSGAVILSIVFDRTGAGLSRVFVNGVEAGSGSYTTPLDPVQSVGVMTNRNRNAFFDGAVGEILVSGSVANTADYVAYLANKWGIA